MRIIISIKLVKMYFVLQRVICANISSRDHGVSSVCSPGPKSEELRTVQRAPSASALLCPCPRPPPAVYVKAGVCHLTAEAGASGWQ